MAGYLTYSLICSLAALVAVVTAYSCPEQCDCFSSYSRLIISCDEQNLTQIPDLPVSENDRAKAIISLDGNRITRLTNNSLGNLTNVISVQLDSNLITEIEPLWPGAAMETIMTLRLTSNLLSEELVIAAVMHLANLQILDISRNNLTSLHFLSSLNLPNLQSLLIDNNQQPFGTIDTMFPFPQLSILVLSSNSINSIQTDAFINISTTLTVLDMSDNNLTAYSLFALQDCWNLQNLELGHNQINFTDLSPNLTNIASSLVHLNLSYNHLGVFPTYLTGEMTSLITLFLDECGIAEFRVPSPNFSNYSLATLSLENNNLSLPPAGISQFMELQELNLAGNNIASFSPEMKDSSLLTKITTVDFSRNLYPYPNKRFSRSHPSIQRVVYTHSENLWAVPDYAFELSIHLTHLDLSHNIISYIGYDAFKGIAPQAFIDLSFNRITTLFSDVVPSEPIGLRLNLEGNPYNCDCEGNWLNTLEAEVIPPECNSPVKPENVSSWYLSSQDEWPCVTTPAATTVTTTRFTSESTTVRDETTLTSSESGPNHTTTAQQGNQTTIESSNNGNTSLSTTLETTTQYSTRIGNRTTLSETLNVTSTSPIDELSSTTAQLSIPTMPSQVTDHMGNQTNTPTLASTGISQALTDQNSFTTTSAVHNSTNTTISVLQSSTKQTTMIDSGTEATLTSSEPGANHTTTAQQGNQTTIESSNNGNTSLSTTLETTTQYSTTASTLIGNHTTLSETLNVTSTSPIDELSSTTAQLSIPTIPSQVTDHMGNQTNTPTLASTGMSQALTDQNSFTTTSAVHDSTNTIISVFQSSTKQTTTIDSGTETVTTTNRAVETAATLTSTTSTGIGGIVSTTNSDQQNNQSTPVSTIGPSNTAMLEISNSSSGTALIPETTTPSPTEVLETSTARQSTMISMVTNNSLELSTHNDNVTQVMNVTLNTATPTASQEIDSTTVIRSTQASQSMAITESLESSTLSNNATHLMNTTLNTATPTAADSTTTRQSTESSQNMVTGGPLESSTHSGSSNVTQYVDDTSATSTPRQSTDQTASESMELSSTENTSILNSSQTTTPQTDSVTTTQILETSTRPKSPVYSMTTPISEPITLSNTSDSSNVTQYSTNPMTNQSNSASTQVPEIFTSDQSTELASITPKLSTLSTSIGVTKSETSQVTARSPNPIKDNGENICGRTDASVLLIISLTILQIIPSILSCS